MNSFDGNYMIGLDGENVLYSLVIGNASNSG